MKKINWARLAILGAVMMVMMPDGSLHHNAWAGLGPAETTNQVQLWQGMGMAEYTLSLPSSYILKLGPGTFNDSNLVVTGDSLTIRGDGMWQTHWQASDSLIASCGAGVTDLFLEDMHLKGLSDGGSLIVQGTVNLHLRNVAMDCSTQTFTDTTFIDNCMIRSQKQNGIRWNGANALLNAHNTIFGGNDIPMNETYLGPTFMVGARCFMKGCEVNSSIGPDGCPALTFSDTNTRGFLVNCRVISNLGPAVAAFDSAIVVIYGEYYESTHATRPTLMDSAGARIYTQFVHVNASSDTAWAHRSANLAQSIFSVFQGSLSICTGAGKFHSLGLNTVYTGGAVPWVDPDYKLVGTPISYFVAGNMAYVDVAQADTINVNEIANGSLFIGINRVEGAQPLAADAIFGLDPDAGTLSSYRNASGTSGQIVTYFGIIQKVTAVAP